MVWLMLNQKEPKDYLLASNETHTVKEFVELSFRYAGIEGKWVGQDINEKFVLSKYKEEKFFYEDEPTLMKINSEFYRPAEVDVLWGDSQPARTELNWFPETSFEQLVKKMIDYDMQDCILK